MDQLRHLGVVRAPPTSEAERDGWDRKPRFPVRTDALSDRPVVRYVGRDDVDTTVQGWQRWLPIIAAWLLESRSPTLFVHTPDNDGSSGPGTTDRRPDGGAAIIVLRGFRRALWKSPGGTFQKYRPIRSRS